MNSGEGCCVLIWDSGHRGVSRKGVLSRRNQNQNVLKALFLIYPCI